MKLKISLPFSDDFLSLCAPIYVNDTDLCVFHEQEESTVQLTVKAQKLLDLQRAALKHTSRDLQVSKCY